MRSSNFNDRVQIKAFTLTFIAYVIVSVIASVVLVQFWLPSGLSAEEAARIAETAPLIVIGELFIGSFLGIAAGWFVCQLSGATGLRNSLVLGLVFVAYAIVGVFLHPFAPMWKHVLHLIAPVPNSLIGGYLRLRFGGDIKLKRV